MAAAPATITSASSGLLCNPLYSEHINAVLMTFCINVTLVILHAAKNRPMFDAFAF